MKILRKDVNGDTTQFKFDVKAFSFAVKNLTDGDILVCFGENFDEDLSIKIPIYMSQIITENANHSDSKYSYNTVTIRSSGEGEVEVQCLEY